MDRHTVIGAEDNPRAAQIALRIVRLQKRRDELLQQKTRIVKSVKQDSKINDCYKKLADMMCICVKVAEIRPMHYNNGHSTIVDTNTCSINQSKLSEAQAKELESWQLRAGPMLERVFDAFQELKIQKEKLVHEKPDSWMKDVDDELENIAKQLRLADEELQAVCGTQ